MRGLKSATSNVSLIWVHYPSIVYLVVGKSAACAVTSLLRDIMKGSVHWGKSHAEVCVCRLFRRCGTWRGAAVCRAARSIEANAWSCTRRWCAYVHHLSFNFGWHSSMVFSHGNVGKLWCASICCVERTMCKCLKISVKTLLIRIFFVYLPAFMRVAPSRTRSLWGAKCLKASDLECNKADINNFLIINF